MAKAAIPPCAQRRPARRNAISGRPSPEEPSPALSTAEPGLRAKSGLGILYALAVPQEAGHRLRGMGPPSGPQRSACRGRGSWLYKMSREYGGKLLPGSPHKQKQCRVPRPAKMPEGRLMTSAPSPDRYRAGFSFAVFIFGEMGAGNVWKQRKASDDRPATRGPESFPPIAKGRKSRKLNHLICSG